MQKLGDIRALQSLRKRAEKAGRAVAHREKLEKRRAEHRGEVAGPMVTMSNALVRAGHGLTLAEKRVIAIAISKLDSRKEASLDERRTVKITAAEYAELADCEPHTAYEALKGAKDQIKSRRISWALFDEDGNRDGGADCNWVGPTAYKDSQGYVLIKFEPDILPHLHGLKKHFTTYQLRQASALRSIYSWRVLELLTQFEATGVVEMPIDEFCHAVEAPEKVRADFGAVRRRVIEPAVKELAEKDGWLITWKPVKAGRKVEAVRFEFRRDPQTRLF